MKNDKIMAIFILTKVGIDQNLKIFGSCTDKNCVKSPKKVGKSPVLKKQKWAEKIGCIF